MSLPEWKLCDMARERRVNQERKTRMPTITQIAATLKKRPPDQVTGRIRAGEDLAEVFGSIGAIEGRYGTWCVLFPVSVGPHSPERAGQ